LGEMFLFFHRIEHCNTSQHRLHWREILKIAKKPQQRCSADNMASLWAEAVTHEVSLTIRDYKFAFPHPMSEDPGKSLKRTYITRLLRLLTLEVLISSPNLPRGMKHSSSPFPLFTPSPSIV